MKSQVLHTVWCYISGEAAGEIWHWSLFATTHHTDDGQNEDGQSVGDERWREDERQGVHERQNVHAKQQLQDEEHNRTVNNDVVLRNSKAEYCYPESSLWLMSSFL